MLRGGLMSPNILQVMKEYLKSGGRKTYQIVKESGGKRSDAKKDVKAGLSSRLKSKRMINRIERDSFKADRTSNTGFGKRNMRKKLQLKVRELTRDINKLK